MELHRRTSHTHLTLDSATSNSPSTVEAAFFRLPEEILTLIVHSHVRAHADVRHGEAIALRSLRLIHPRFAFLSSLCKWLFRYVVLLPDPDREQLRDWSFIGPFVREVHLEPLLVTDPDLPWLGQDLRDAARCALKSYQQHIDCGDAAADLVRVLRCLSKLRRVFILSNAKDSQVTFPAVDQLITFATRCLHAAGVEPEELELRNVGIRELWSMDHLAVWISTPIYAELRLNSLTSLHIELQNSSLSDTAQEGFRTITRALCEILGRCKDSLEHLSVATHTVVVWHPAITAPSMARLKSLQLNDCKIEAESFSEWLLTCAALTSVSLAVVALLDNASQLGLDPWRPVFDAVRRHSCSVRLQVDDMELVYDYGLLPDKKRDLGEVDISLIYDTSRPTPESKESDDDCHPEWPQVEEMLKGYMSGTQKWVIPHGW